MSLKTRFGNLKNVLDEDNSQTEILTLESPFSVQYAVPRDSGGVFGRIGCRCEIDCTCSGGSGGQCPAGSASQEVRAEGRGSGARRSANAY